MQYQLNALRAFGGDEDGAITVDWVVLTAAIIGLGIAVLVAISAGVGDTADSVQGCVDGARIGFEVNMAENPSSGAPPATYMKAGCDFLQG
ncbi:MAG: hypothetical protein AAF618_01645 [Pseudomonadota bacterium]